MKSIRGKVVVVTGAGSGIGRSLVLKAAGAGAHVAFCDISDAGLAETVAMLPPGTQHFAAKVDCGSREAIYAFAADVERTLGRAAVVVNNAGVSLSQTIEKMSDDDFKWLFDINFWGVVHGTRAFLPQLMAEPEGHVVNISSVFGIIAVPTQAAYNASKFAVRGFTEALRQELSGTSVGVTCVHPGGIRTGIVRNGRHYEDPLGVPTDVAKAAKQFELAARTSPDQAADVILDAILRRRPRALIGPDAYAIDAVQRLFPTGYDAVTRFALKLGQRARGK